MTHNNHNIRFAVVGHHSRLDHAFSLMKSLNAVLFLDENNHGSSWNHHRALSWAKEQQERVVIIEDDAKPVKNFVNLVTKWFELFPESLISFYLGTGRPPQYQSMIAEKLIAADKIQSDYIKLPRLIHGVCYSVPKNALDKVIANWNSQKPADFAVGDAWQDEVIYPCYSLVDHLDETPVENHCDKQKRTERRRAWRIHG